MILTLLNETILASDENNEQVRQQFTKEYEIRKERERETEREGGRVKVRFCSRCNNLCLLVIVGFEQLI